MMIYPRRQIFIRVRWHDAGLDVRVCNAPELNSSCMKLKRTGEDRADAAEEALASRRLDKLSSQYGKQHCLLSVDASKGPETGV